MDVHTEFTRVSLAGDESMQITDAVGAEVLVCRGRVWLTQYGDSRDIILRTGQSYVLERPLGVVTSAGRGEAQVILRGAPLAPRPARSWLGRLLARAGTVWQADTAARQAPGRIHSARAA